MSNLKCVWGMGTPCSGKVEEVSFFDGQITVPVCEGHTEEHRDVMILHKNNYDIEQVLQMTNEERRKEVLTLKLSGLSDGEEVEL